MNNMNLDTFVREGYLQEANRQFFHQYGLELMVVKEVDGTPTMMMLNAQQRKTGLLFDWEDEEQLEKARAMEAHVKRVLCDRVPDRYRLLGYRIQPIPEKI